MLKPNYTITSKMLSHLTEIAEIKAVVERSRVLPLNEAQLRRQAILRMAHTSTSIEGNKLAQYEVGKVIESQIGRSQKIGEQLGLQNPYEVYFPFLKKDKVAKFLSETAGIKVGSQGYF